MSNYLWKPSQDRIDTSGVDAFRKRINEKYGTNLASYPELYDWSVGSIPEFWKEIWDFVGILSSKPFDRVVDDVSKMPGARWFEGARLNFAENLLRCRDDSPAIIFRGELGERRQISFRELYQSVAKLSGALRACGVKSGDRIAGMMPNIPETVIAMLAATSIGAAWSSCSPDFGVQGVLDRFGQIRPKILFATDGYYFKGKKQETISRVSSIVSQIPGIEKVVLVNFTGESDISKIKNGVDFNEFLEGSKSLEIEFEQLPFDHPLYIMYSSGTTGLPKCLVQGPGVLLNHLKELKLHTDLKKGEKIFYYTTCGWMMWNWLVSALAAEACIVLFDGNPFYPDSGALWKIAQEEKIQVFGTSARYIAACEADGLRPKEKFDLSSVRAILSTGSPLSLESFEYIYRDVKSDVQLASISGGTDLNGCFALGVPVLPVYKGELQCRGLGMKVEIFDDKGRPLQKEKGELVCTAAFPSMPLYFWNDPEGKKYHDAYFDTFPGIWRHGDFAEITEHGGLIVYGRSDATLNPGGVRIGTADLYRQVEAFSEIADSVVIGQDYRDDIRIILFVKMKEGHILTDALKSSIKEKIRANVSPRHMPALIISVPDIPYTLNMKKVELAVKKTVQNEPVLNKDALINPQSLDYFRDLAELK